MFCWFKITVLITDARLHTGYNFSFTPEYTRNTLLLRHSTIQLAAPVCSLVHAWVRWWLKLIFKGPVHVHQSSTMFCDTKDATRRSQLLSPSARSYERNLNNACTQILADITWSRINCHESHPPPGGGGSHSQLGHCSEQLWQYKASYSKPYHWYVFKLLIILYTYTWLVQWRGQYNISIICNTGDTQLTTPAFTNTFFMRDSP
jgi:hypothetical protein